jgi:hypothetical protein
LGNDCVQCAVLRLYCPCASLLLPDDIERDRTLTGKHMGRLKSLFICGAGHSGSTLLGMVLGGAEGAFYVGEGGKARYLHDLNKPLRKRACKICGDDCPVWSGFQWDGEAPLHARIAAHVGAHTIVDSTKDANWITRRAAETHALGGSVGLVFLQRDGRAVVNSRLRKYPDRDPVAQIDQWVDQMTRSRALFDGFEGAKVELQYEAFATDPNTSLAQVCDTLGIGFDPAMLDFTRRDHHQLGGNTGTQFVAAGPDADQRSGSIQLTERTNAYYADHPGDIRLDLRWREEMSPAHLALFEHHAGHINQTFRWDQTP